MPDHVMRHPLVDTRTPPESTPSSSQPCQVGNLGTLKPGETLNACEYCKQPVWTARGIELYLDCNCKEGKLLRDRKNEDKRQRKLERTNKLRATDLEDRDLAQKEKAMARREARQEAADDADDSGQVEGGEPLEAFVGKMAEADDAPPSALLRRNDGEVLFYDGKVNWVFGEPGAGKSWLALYVVQESLLWGQRTVFWDFEMSPGQTKARCQALGLDLVEAERAGSFLYLKPFAEESKLAMSQLKEWQMGGDGPALVVIDAAASSGAPSDGGDVEPWLKTFVKPFEDEGHTLLVIDHVPKQRVGRADGPIGSARKLQAVTGAALDLSGIAWTQKKDGVVKLRP